MRELARWFNHGSSDLSSVIGGSRDRSNAIESALVITRSDAPAAQAPVFFDTPHPEIGRLRAKHRGAEPKSIRQLIRNGWIR